MNKKDFFDDDIFDDDFDPINLHELIDEEDEDIESIDSFERKIYAVCPICGKKLYSKEEVLIWNEKMGCKDCYNRENKKLKPVEKNVSIEENKKRKVSKKERKKKAITRLIYSLLVLALFIIIPAIDEDDMIVPGICVGSLISVLILNNTFLTIWMKKIVRFCFYVGVKMVTENGCLVVIIFPFVVASFMLGVAVLFLCSVFCSLIAPFVLPLALIRNIKDKAIKPPSKN